MVNPLAVLALLLGAAQPPTPTCRTVDRRIEELVSAKARELKGEEYCQSRRYETLSDVDGDGQPDFMFVFSVEGIGGGGNDVKQFLAVWPSASRWAPRIADCGARGTRLVESIEVKDRSILLHTSEYRPEDPMCCPSGQGIITFRLEGQGLVEQKTPAPAEKPGQTSATATESGNPS